MVIVDLTYVSALPDFVDADIAGFKSGNHPGRQICKKQFA
jgi:hypothetical protein